MLPIHAQQIVEAFSLEYFSIKIFTTGDCNYSCVSCYESHVAINRANFATKTKLKIKPVHMRQLSRPHINGIKNTLTQRAKNGLKILTLSWFGGEPLLEPKIIEEIHQHANSLGIKKIIGAATTNFSAVNGKMLKKYCDMGLTEFYMTLEGERSDHNKTRPLIGGKGTYDKLIANLLIAKGSSHPFKIGIRVHVHRGNLKNMPDFLIYLRDTFLVDKRFNMDIKPIGDYGGESVKALKLFGWEEKKTVLAELQKFVQINEAKATTPEPRKGCYVCYATSPNSMVILNTGEVAKCTVFQEPVGVLMEDGKVRFFIDPVTKKPKVLWYYRGWDKVKASGGKDTILVTCAHAGK